MKLNVQSASAATVVAGAAFIASAGHIVHVVSETNPIYFALAYPIGIDGLIYVGIRALQAKRYTSGSIALLIGAIYSLAFNGHAEGAFTMPAWMIASSMPICMFAAFIIEAFGETEKEEAPMPAPAPAAPVAVPAAPVYRRPATVPANARLLPIAPPFAPKPVVPAKKAPAKTVVNETIKEAPKATGAGRPITWDFEKAVKLIVSDGQNDSEIASVVGTNAKSVYTLRRVIRLLSDGQNVEQVAEITKKSTAFVSRAAAAIKED